MGNAIRFGSLGLGMLLSACITSNDKGPTTTTSDTIVQASTQDQEKSVFKTSQDLWNSSKPAKYTFQLSRNCFCFPYGWMQVSVEGDKVVKVDTVPGVDGPFDRDSFSDAPSIDDVFDQVDGYLNNPDYQVKAQYDGRVGYPVSVKIHHLLNYEDADAEFQIASFKAN